MAMPASPARILIAILRTNWRRNHPGGSHAIWR